jgi:hypothetical protein
MEHILCHNSKCAHVVKNLQISYMFDAVVYMLTGGEQVHVFFQTSPVILYMVV